MSLKRKILLWAGGLAGALLSGLWALDSSGVFVRALKPQVAAALASASGRSVELGSIQGGIFGSIVINDLSLGFSGKGGLDASVQVKRAKVRFSLWDYFVRKKGALASLKSLRLDEPVITLLLPPGQISAAGAPARPSMNEILSSLPLPPLSTEINGGSVSLMLSRGGERELLFEGLDAALTAEADGGSARLRLSGRAYGGRLTLRGRFSPGPATASASLDLKGLDLARLSRGLWLPATAPRLDTGRADGRFSLELGRGFSAKGSLRLSGVGMKLGSQSAVEGLQADLALDGKRLALEQLRFRSQGALWQGRGEIADLSAPELALRVVSADGRPAWKGLSADGAMLALRASRQGVALEGLTLSSGVGSLLAWGSATFKSGTAAALDFSLKASQFPLGPLSAAVDGEAHLGGDSAQPQARARLKSASASAGPERFENLSLALDLSGAQSALAVQGDWRGIKGIQLSAQGRLEKAQFTLRQEGLVPWAKGSAAFEGGKLRVAGSLLGFESADLSKAFGLGLALKGPLSGSFKLEGKPGDPEFSASLDGRQLLAGAAEPMPLLAQLRVKSGHFRLESLELRGGEVSAAGGDDGYELRMKRASLAQFAALAPQLSGNLEGKADGLVALSRKDGAWSAQGKLGLEGLKAWGQAASSLSLEGGLSARQWKLSRLEARQEGGGSLLGLAEFDPVGKGSAEIKLRSRGWQVSGRALSFDLDASGAKAGKLARWFKKVAEGVTEKSSEISGELSLTDFKADGRELPDFKGEWGWYESLVLKLRNLQWGQGVGASAEWSQAAGVKARLSAQEADWRPWAALFGLEREAVKAPLNAELSLASKGGYGEGKVTLKGGAEASARWRPSSGKTRFEGEAGLKDFELARALEIAGLWADAGTRESLRPFAGKISAALAFDSGSPVPLSFSAQIDRLRQGSQGWGPLSLGGELEDGAWHLERLELGEPKSRILAQDLRFKKGPDGMNRLSSLFEAEGFPDGAFMRLSGQGSLSLAWNQDGGQAELSWPLLRLNRQEFSAGGIKAAFKPGRLELSELKEPSRLAALLSKDKERGWRLESFHAALDKEGELGAKQGLDEEGKETLEVSGKAVEASLIAKLLDWKIDLQGLVYGNGVFRLPKAKDGYLSMLLSVKVENGALEGFPFDLAVGNVGLENGVLDIKPLGEPARVMRRGRYEAEASGRIPLYTNDDRPLPEMRLDGSLVSGNLGLIDYLDVIDSAGGTVTASASVRGTALYPEFNFKADVRGGSIKFKRLLAPAGDVQAQLLVEGNKLQILRLDAQMGGPGQRIYVERGPEAGPAVLFDQWVIARLNLKLSSGKGGIQAAAQPGYQFIAGNLAPDLALTGTWDEPEMKGRLLLSDASVTWPAVRKGPEVPDDPKSFSGRLYWDLLATAGERVSFRSVNSLTKVETVRADIGTEPGKGLRLLGPGANLMLDGRIRPGRGRISFFSADFTINPDKESRVEFRREQPPYLSLWGYRDVRTVMGNDTRVELYAYGELGKIQVDLKSDDPELSQAQMASMVGLGTDDPSKAPGEVVGKALTWLGRAIGSQIGNKLLNSDHALDFNVRAPIIGRMISRSDTAAALLSQTAQSTQNFEVEVGKQIFPKVYVKGGYGQKEDAKKGTENTVRGTVEFDLGKGQKIETEAGTEGVSAQYKAQGSFENYDPRKRREELRKRHEKTPTATPTPVSP